MRARWSLLVALLIACGGGDDDDESSAGGNGNGSGGSPSSVHATPTYLKQLVRVLVDRAVRRAREAAA